MCELQQPALLTPSPLLLRIPLAASRTLGKIKPVARVPAPCPWKRSDRRTQYSSNHIARISRRNVSLPDVSFRPGISVSPKRNGGASKSNPSTELSAAVGANTRSCVRRLFSEPTTKVQTLDTTSTVFGYCVGCGTVGSSRYVAASLRSITNSMGSSVPWSPPSVPSGARTLVVCRVQGRTTEATLILPNEVSYCY